MPKKSKLGRQRNSVQNSTYKNSGRKRKNKLRRLMRHLIAYPNDAQAEASLANIERGKVGVKGRHIWVTKYKPNKSKDGEPMKYRERIK